MILTKKYADNLGFTGSSLLATLRPDKDYELSELQSVYDEIVDYKCDDLILKLDDLKHDVFLKFLCARLMIEGCNISTYLPITAIPNEEGIDIPSTRFIVEMTELFPRWIQPLSWMSDNDIVYANVSILRELFLIVSGLQNFKGFIFYNPDKLSVRDVVESDFGKDVWPSRGV